LGDYGQAADLYDLLYLGIKDYRAEAELLAGLVRERCPGARRLLDVGCGTGEHARHLSALGFEVDGVDLEPTFVEIARKKCPQGRFEVADMTALDLPRRYDAVLSLFSAIGYVRTRDALRRTLVRLAAHLVPGGMVVVDPWFEPGQLTNHYVTMATGEGEGLTVCRMSRTVIEGTTSHLEFEYLVGRGEGLERRSEIHELGMFTQAEMEEAFRGAGLSVERLPEALRMRGLYVGRPTPSGEPPTPG
jgi:SAM-dependent methyltransferase